MEKQMTIDMDKVIFQATPEVIYQGMCLYVAKLNQKNLPDFEADRISKSQAAKLAGISIPTLSKDVARGRFKEHCVGQRRKYFLKSEIIESLRNNG